MMHSLEWLIDYHKKSEIACADTRDKAAVQKGKNITDADRKRSADIWEEERQVSRDTVAFLEVVQRRAWALVTEGHTGASASTPPRGPKSGSSVTSKG